MLKYRKSGGGQEESEEQCSRRAEEQKSRRAEEQCSRRAEEQKSRRAEEQKSRRAEEQKGRRAEEQKSRRAEEQKSRRAEEQKSAVAELKNASSRDLETQCELRALVFLSTRDPARYLIKVFPGSRILKNPNAHKGLRRVFKFRDDAFLLIISVFSRHSTFLLFLRVFVLFVFANFFARLPQGVFYVLHLVFFFEQWKDVVYQLS